MTEEMCKDCPWKLQETCGACRADRERRELDKKGEKDGKRKVG